MTAPTAPTPIFSFSTATTGSTPQLEFVLDKGIQHSVKISSLLDDIRQEREEREAALNPPEAAEGDEAGDGDAGADPEDEPDADLV